MGLLPPIVEVLEADIHGFVSKMDQATGKLDEVDRLSTGISKRQVQATAVGLMAVGAVVTGAGAALVAISDPIEKAQATLQQVIENTGARWSAYAGKVDAAVSSEARFGHGSADTQTALGKLTAAYQDPTKALAEMALTTDIAAFKHINLADAAAIVVRMHAGAAKTFKEFGINITDMAKLTTAAAKATKEHETAIVGLTKAEQHLADVNFLLAGKTSLTRSEQLSLRDATQAVTAAQAKVTETTQASVAATAAAAGATKNYDQIMATQLAPRLKGIAQAQAETFGGHLDYYRTQIMNLAGAVGQNLGPALITIGPALTGTGIALQTFTMMTREGIVAVLGFAAPILLIAAGVVAVGAAFYLAYTHIKPFRDAVDGLTVVLYGDFGAALHYLGYDLLPKVRDVLGFVGMAARVVAETAWPELRDAGSALFQSLQEILNSFTSIFSVFDQTSGHADPAAGSVRGVGSAAQDTGASLMKFATSPGVLGFLDFFAVELPAAVSIGVNALKLTFDMLQPFMDGMVTIVKVALDVMHGDFSKADQDISAGWAKQHADMTNTITDSTNLWKSITNETDGTIEQRNAEFNARLIGGAVGLTASIDTHTEGMATNTRNAFDAIHAQATARAAETRDGVTGYFAGMGAGVNNSMDTMSAATQARFAAMATGVVSQARALHLAIVGASIIPDMAKGVVKSFDWMKGESLGHWADMSKGITAHAQGMANPGASAWGGGSLAAAGGGSRAGGWGDVTININGANKDPRQIATEVRDELLRMKRTTGTLGLA